MRDLDTLLVDFLRYHALFSIFDGNVDDWLDTLTSMPDAAWCACDREFLMWLKRLEMETPGSIAKARTAIEGCIALLEELPTRASD